MSREAGAPVDWRRLDGDEADEEWAGLVAWVTWLRDRYDLGVSDLPECWWRHGASIEELTAVRIAYEAAYDPDGGGGTLPSVWHLELDQVLDRLRRRWLRGCAGGDCTAKPAESPTPES